MKKKVLFLDRDGVVNIDKKYVHKIEDFEFCDGIFDLCEYFLQRGYLICVITNQSGIARGYYTEKDFEILSAYMIDEFLKKGITIEKIYHCPHLNDCECRKPKPAMLLKAKKEFNVDMNESFFIGDNLSDMEAGMSANVKNLFLINNNYTSNDKFKTFNNLKTLLEYIKDIK
ncbi:D-glycero-alpha-D-manno-heptose-1,7-bisphosphate 7-phosphatase [Campylobacter insulaenigrae]|uniref:D-glycero-alpha-D-manno-heptose-1,7-bisphosphate 7-phosphatase n=1 Tax=Campylobacter insulaenigrae TaxID=260714 RepID=UPI00215372F9|nr:HAD family hydrolase [Campylobacter insulaenigrae]MCR6594592.1 HAD family hydrolase [Campylobacter insulaenigrae]